MMHGIAFTLGPLKIHWYGIMAALGFLSAVLTLYANRKKAGLSQDDVFNFSFIAILGGLFGARLFYVIQFHEQFRNNFLDIFRVDKGGLVFYGGFIFALTWVVIYCFRKKIDVLKLLDIFAPAIAVAHMFGRIGCYLQGCCFGKPGCFIFSKVYPYGTPGAARYPAVKADLYAEMPVYPDSLPLYPVQLVESFLNFEMFLMLLFLLKKNKTPGCVAAVYLAGYALMRFSTELMRGDHTDFFLGIFTPSQTIALFVMLPAAGAVAFFAKKRAEKNAGK